MTTPSMSAELFKFRTRPATWILSGTWLALTVAFGFGIPLIVYLALSGDPGAVPNGDPEDLIRGLLPQNMATTGASMFPVFGSAIVLILGALSAGSEYHWGTWSQMLTQQPSRAAVFLGKVSALAVVLLGIVVATFAAVAVASIGVALVDGRSVSWPGPGAIAGAIAGTWLISIAWANFGLALAMLFRSSATAIAVGLVWGLVVEVAIIGLALAATPFEVLQKVLMGPNAGSIVAALGAATQTGGGAPGVVAANSGIVSVAIVAAYAALFAAFGVYLVQRRDIV